ncbi:hypothetical protein Plhal703r1_c03g0016621 [Plasmopara halstedii]
MMLSIVSVQLLRDDVCVTATDVKDVDTCWLCDGCKTSKQTVNRSRLDCLRRPTCTPDRSHECMGR